MLSVIIISSILYLYLPLILSDDIWFDSLLNNGNNWITNGPVEFVTNDNECTSADNNCMSLYSNAWAKRVTDVSAYTSLSVHFWLTCHGLTGITNNKLKFQWNEDDGLYNNLWTQTDNTEGCSTCNTETIINLPTDADNQKTLWIRFDIDGNQGECWIDELTLRGTLIPPSKSPTINPSKSPTKYPTISPTNNPSKSPTDLPSKSPSKYPTNIPTKSPSNLPSISPTKYPTLFPTHSPTKFPTKIPTEYPTKMPSITPSNSPTKSPTTPAPTLVLNVDGTTISPTHGPTVNVDINISATENINKSDDGKNIDENNSNVGILILLKNPYLLALLVIVIVLLCLICVVCFYIKRTKIRKQNMNRDKQCIELTTVMSANLDDEKLESISPHDSTISNAEMHSNFSGMNSVVSSVNMSINHKLPLRSSANIANIITAGNDDEFDNNDMYEGSRSNDDIDDDNEELYADTTQQTVGNDIVTMGESHNQTLGMAKSFTNQ